MDATPISNPPSRLLVGIALAVCALVVAASLAATAWLFQRERLPFERLAAATACAADQAVAQRAA